MSHHCTPLLPAATGETCCQGCGEPMLYEPDDQEWVPIWHYRYTRLGYTVRAQQRGGGEVVGRLVHWDRFAAIVEVEKGHRHRRVQVVCDPTPSKVALADD